MNRSFDIRLKKDQEKLADLLPTIDNHTYNISRETFIGSLNALAKFLKNPEWMIYQWGSFHPIPIGGSTVSLSLSDACDLGIYLKCLSKFDNFHKLLEGFFNPTQFLDAFFEAKVAYWFALLQTTRDIKFSPEYIVRGRAKRPEFDVFNLDGITSVECKRPHPYVQKACKKFQSYVEQFKLTMQKNGWPSNLRLEIEFVDNIKGSIVNLAQETIKKALKLTEIGLEEFSLDSIKGFVVQRNSPFRITNIKYGTDIMILDRDEATGLFNPKFTSLRMVSNRLDAQLTKSVGSRINEALSQLPNTQKCIIFIGDVPYRITKKACERRLSDPAYKHIIAFGVWHNELKFIFRKSDKSFMDLLIQNPLKTNN